MLLQLSWFQKLLNHPTFGKPNKLKSLFQGLWDEKRLINHLSHILKMRYMANYEVTLKFYQIIDNPSYSLTFIIITDKDCRKK